MIHFIRPYWLLALIPLAFFLYRVSLSHQRTSNWNKVCDPHLMEHLVLNKKHMWRSLAIALLIISWLLSVLALAGPSWTRTSHSVYRSPQATVIALDLSNSMNASDNPPTRLQRAKFKITDLLSQNEAREGQMGFLVFTSKSFVMLPLATDTNTIKTALPSMTSDVVPVHSTYASLGVALRKAGELLTQGGVNKGSIILATDSAATPADISLAKKLFAEGFKVSVLALGTSQGAPIAAPGGGFVTNKAGAIVVSRVDMKSLRALANAGGGVFTTLTNNNADIQRLLSAQVTHDIDGAKQSKDKVYVWHDNGRWFIFPVLFLVLILFRRGWLEVL